MQMAQCLAIIVAIFLAPRVSFAAPPTTRPASPWPKLTATEQAEAVEKLKAFADDASTKLDRRLSLFETQYFLFYTDLPQREAQNWASLLDRMYMRLAELFAVKKGENIWRGKGLIFVFAKASDYRNYERQVEKTDPIFSAGRCHARHDGTVHIAFYKQDRELSFAHVLVHESVHGFIHRYRTAAIVPSWANEGLADAIATELVPDPPTNPTRQQVADALRKHNNELGKFFRTPQIEPWQYPVAETLTQFMILQSKRNYVDFINGIKDGQDWETSLDKNYKAPLERLIPAYGAWVGVKGLSE
jgi:hypothetical protein